MTILLIALGVVAALVIVLYNRLVSLKNRVENGWGDIQVQLKRRYDLIPNLVETVKGYADFERDTLTKVTEARNAAMNNNGTPEQQAQTENFLTGALKSLFALAEAYPDLKANNSYLDLQRQLAETEDKIESARRYYNATVRDMNTAVEQFPSNLIANSFKFSKAEVFDLDGPDDPARDAPKVDF